jgi:hypothetical protein
MFNKKSPSMKMKMKADSAMDKKAGIKPNSPKDKKIDKMVFGKKDKK